MLRDLSVQNYRCFEDFKIDGLAGVNLFVGNNNTGKTSLLEAVYLLVSPDRERALALIVKNRVDHFLAASSKLSYDFNSFFYERNIKDNIHLISRAGKYLHIAMRIQQNHFVASQIYKTNLPGSDPKRLLDLSVSNSGVGTIEEHDNENANIVYKVIFLPIKKIDFQVVSLMWDAIDLTPKEDKVIDALRIIEPDIDRIGFSSNPQTEAVRLKLKGQDSPVSLSSMGEGIHRILTIAMSLVTSENGVLLVDEIETGLHYEAQTDMWRLILETAKELNVQVFATTHSWDCIAAFQEALSQVEDKSIGKLFRLDNKYGKLRAVEYDAEKLDVAVRNSIEVR